MDKSVGTKHVFRLNVLQAPTDAAFCRFVGVGGRGGVPNARVALTNRSFSNRAMPVCRYGQMASDVQVIMRTLLKHMRVLGVVC